MLDSANFLFEHAWGPIYGWFSNRGLRFLVLPTKALAGRHVYLLHSTVNLTWGRRLHTAFERYFAGMEETFGGVPLDLESGTPFQRTVWQTARKIPWGNLSTYGDLARLMGHTKGAARAVGQALRANPVPILVPCHRFIAADGGLGGFSAGLDWKRGLLRIEGHSFLAGEPQRCNDAADARPHRP